MDMEAFLRTVATIVDRAWFRCEFAANRELLSQIGAASREVAIELRKDAERKAEYAATIAKAAAAHAGRFGAGFIHSTRIISSRAA